LKSRTLKCFPDVADEFDDFAQLWLNGGGGPPAGEMLPLLRHADLVVFNGEGSLVGRAKKGTRPLFLLYLAKRYLGKRCAIINHTAHLETSTPVLLSMARRVYPLMDYVSVREPASRENLLAARVLEDVPVVPDALFAAQLVDPERARFQPLLGFEMPQGPLVCVTGSSLSSDARPWHPSAAYVELVRGLRELHITPVLVAKDQSDQFLREVAGETGAALFGPERSYQELYFLLARSQLFVSGRYHPIILSALAGCPFLPLSANTHKIDGLCELLEYPLRRPFDFLDLRAELPGLMKTARGLLVGDGRMRSQLRTRALQLAWQAQAHCGQLQQLLGEPF
jgi:polysaccharide pyruvyl transferase WcaK-like protein